jgi:hypothetical protein
MTGRSREGKGLKIPAEILLILNPTRWQNSIVTGSGWRSGNGGDRSDLMLQPDQMEKIYKCKHHVLFTPGLMNFIC